MEATAATNVPITGETPQVHDNDAVGDLRLAIRLWMEGRAAHELDAGQLEQFLPEVAGEDRVTIAHNGARKAMELDDIVEECSSHGLRGAGMAQGHEVSHHGELIDDGQDDVLATDPQKTLHEVHGYVTPDMARHQ
jgi:hypothetical protein